MTFPEALATLQQIAQAWRSEEFRALDRNDLSAARDCLLRASAITEAIEALKRAEKENRKKK